MSQTVRPLPGQPRAAPFDAYDPSARVFTLGENEPGGWDILRQLWRRNLLITGVTFCRVGAMVFQIFRQAHFSSTRVLRNIKRPRAHRVMLKVDAIMCHRFSGDNRQLRSGQGQKRHGYGLC